MNSVVVVVAQYLLFVILAAAAAIWLFLPGHDKGGLAVKTVVSLDLMVVLIKVAAGLYTDPRPIVTDPLLRALFPHPADNGFPSDHTALAATVALLEMMYRRWLGALLLAASGALGAARVAANVHHEQDIFAGLLIAAAAVGLAAAIWWWVGPRLPRRLTEPAWT